jgi:DNA-binding CsgD family transcriptional regulator
MRRRWTLQPNGSAASPHRPIALPESLEALAGLAALDGDLERAARLFGAAETVRQLSGVQPLPWLRSARDGARASVRERLGSDGFDELWVDAGRLPMPDAIDLGLGSSMTVAKRPVLTRLTRRERAVATMVARGMSNRDIATELVISRRTAEAHVEHVRNKLGVATRGQVAVLLRPSSPPPAPPVFTTTDTLTGIGTQRFTGTYPHEVNFATLTFSGLATFRAANGDKLFIQLGGSGSPISPTTFNIALQGAITGGTGRFQSASGNVTGTGTVNLGSDPGEVSASLSGQLRLF